MEAGTIGEARHRALNEVLSRASDLTRNLSRGALECQLLEIVGRLEEGGRRIDALEARGFHRAEGLRGMVARVRAAIAQVDDEVGRSGLDEASQDLVACQETFITRLDSDHLVSTRQVMIQRDEVVARLTGIERRLADSMSRIRSKLLPTVQRMQDVLGYLEDFEEAYRTLEESCWRPEVGESLMLSGPSALAGPEGRTLDGRYFLSDRRLVFEEVEGGLLVELRNWATGSRSRRSVAMEIAVRAIDAAQVAPGSGRASSLAVTLVTGGVPYVIDSTEARKLLRGLTIHNPRLGTGRRPSLPPRTAAPRSPT